MGTQGVAHGWWLCPPEEKKPFWLAVFFLGRGQQRLGAHGALRGAGAALTLPVARAHQQHAVTPARATCTPPRHPWVPSSSRAGSVLRSSDPVPGPGAPPRGCWGSQICSPWHHPRHSGMARSVVLWISLAFECCPLILGTVCSLLGLGCAGGAHTTAPSPVCFWRSILRASPPPRLPALSPPVPAAPCPPPVPSCHRG